jgi:hypothetical protein
MIYARGAVWRHRRVAPAGSKCRDGGPINRKVRPMFATTWGTGQVLLDILWFFLLLLEIWLIFLIISDLFRRHDMKGWLKAFWVFFVIVLPLFGILLYLILYGDEMRVHAQQDAASQERAFRQYIQGVAGHGSPAEELTRLSELRDRGVINDEEFQRLKDRIVNG